MRYNVQFETKNSQKFSISSMEDYVVTDWDIELFLNVLSDKNVFQYITDESMKKWEYTTVRSLAEEILGKSSVRWTEEKEKRFLLRDKNSHPVGMVGVNLISRTDGELWYYKTAAVGSCMYQALTFVLDFLRTEEIENLIANVHMDNKQSQEILLKLGFQRGKTREDEIEFSKILDPRLRGDDDNRTGIIN